MKITNVHGLPDPVVAAIQNDGYDKGDSDYTVTELVAPPRLVTLRRQHEDEITVDAADRFWALLGQCAHGILERVETFENHPEMARMREVRLYMEMLGKKVGGQIDDFHKGILSDWKTTSVWSKVYGSRDQEWETQLNFLAQLLRENGHKVDGVQIVAIYRDWMESSVETRKNYPVIPCEVIPFELWPEEDAKAAMTRAVAALEAASKGNMPKCSPEETWEKTDRRGNVTRKRCERYCDAMPFCDQYQNWKASQ